MPRPPPDERLRSDPATGDGASSGWQSLRKDPRGSSPTRGTNKPRVLVVHCSPVTRFGLTALLSQSGRYEVCGQAAAAPAARELFELHQPELVVTGLTLEGGDGFGLIKDFLKLYSMSRALVFSTRDDPLAVQRAFRAGARAFVMAGDETAEILKALDRILEGELYASVSIGHRLLENLADGRIRPNDSKFACLSDRELQVFSLFGRGFGATRLAAELHLSVKTIEAYQTRIKAKLGLESMIELRKQASLWMSEIARRQLIPRRDRPCGMRRLQRI